MKKVHIIPHSHWDREWYMPFEYHRAYLVKLVDNCLELFETDEAYAGFHLDGHTALVEDYLEIKPQNAEKIAEYVKQGKFAVGPWYILQDEFLTSGEANIRNLLVGMDLAQKLGKVTRIGYFPDSFGNAGQMPQILKQAGMKAIVFGRGVKSLGMNNQVTEDQSYASKYSEIIWQSPDGSGLPAIVLSNWYNNGQEIPVDGDKAWWDRVLENVEKYASTDELLVLNGCDHQPVQMDLTAAIAAARKQYPDYQFIHSDFEGYVDACVKNLPEDVATVTGELIGQDTNGWFSLVNTCSAHVDLKILNRKCEVLLEGVAEPLSVMASSLGKADSRSKPYPLGKPYPHEMLLYAWKTLMKNHPHDSICGCSCDEVNAEMQTRFAKAKQATEMIIREDLEFIKSHVDVAGFEDCEATFAVVNTMAFRRNALVSADLELRRVYGVDNLHQTFLEYNQSLYQGDYELVDEAGQVCSCEITGRRSRFGYDLPADRFRQPYVAEMVTVSFEAVDVPAMGYKVYGLRRAVVAGRQADEAAETVAAAPGTRGAAEQAQQDNTLENAYLKAAIQADGRIDLLDKQTGRLFTGLMQFEDTGDIGTEYTYIGANAAPIYSGDRPARIELLRDLDFVKEYKVTVEMSIPISKDQAAEEEAGTYVALPDRRGGRSAEHITLEVVSYISLTKNGKRLDVRTEINNQARDHRLRVLFPTGLHTDTHKAESVFEAAKRSNAHKDTWENPSGCEHQQGFVMMQEEGCGLAIANIGLYEYETLGNTMAVTLLRAVGEMGDWGVFPTELSQQQKELCLEYAIIPFGEEKEVYPEAVAFQCPVLCTPLDGCDGAALDRCDEAVMEREMLSWQGDHLKCTAVKNKMNGDDLILRWVNYSDKEQMLTIRKTGLVNNLYRSNVIEEKGEVLEENAGEWSIVLGPYEIFTAGVSQSC